MKKNHHSELERRRFLQFAASAGIAAGTAWRAGGATQGYQVGVGGNSDPYIATMRAIESCAQFPSQQIAGNTVIIKPNLVTPVASTTGVTTDPQVVRAIVDQSLQAGAAQILIVEAGGSKGQPNFGPCGYSLFSSYNPRVQLLSLGTEPFSYVTVPNGLAYSSMYMFTPVLTPNSVFISAGKLKTHVDAVATLSMKNLFGLVPPQEYQIGASAVFPRFDLHARGVHQSVVDLNLVRPVDFAVIDGIVGLEGNGPLNGTPVQMNVVLAGRNAVAVDRTALQVMQVPQSAATYLFYAALRGLGPADLSGTTLLGDALPSAPFVPAAALPLVLKPALSAKSISLGSRTPLSISCSLQSKCFVNITIMHDPDNAPNMKQVRLLHTWAQAGPGTSNVSWDLHDDSGQVVPPGDYLAQIQASYQPATGRINYASSLFTVTA